MVMSVGVSMVAPPRAQAAADDVLTDVYFYWSNSAKTSSPCLPGYDWDPDDTNMGIKKSGADFIYLCAKYEPLSSGVAPITGVKVYNSDSDGTCGPGWTGARADDDPAPKDLNDDNGGNYIYLCYTTTQGTYPVLDLDIVALFPWFCRDSTYTGIDENLNTGTAGIANYLCYQDTSSLGYSFDCGGEGERPCGVDTRFFWENGSGVCDRGLKQSGDTCVASTRRQGAVDDFRGTWIHWALLNQVNQLAYDATIGTYTMVGAHNAFNSQADGYAFPNQKYSITDQLRAGIRVIDLDIHAGKNGAETVTGSLPELCHGNDLHVGCVVGDRLFDSALKEIRHWMLQPENLDQTVVIVLEDYIDRDPEEVYFGISTLLDREVGVWRQDNYSGARPLPSRHEMLAAGKRVLLLAQSDNYSGLVFEKTGDKRVAQRSGGIPIDDFVPGTCNTTGESFDGGKHLIEEINGDRAAGGARPMTRQDLADLSRCAIDIANIDYVLAATEDPDGGRLRGAIWSWEESDRGDNGDVAMLVGATGRWRSIADAEASRPYACRTPRAEGGWAWGITPGSGRWLDGWDACERAFGTGSQFAVPTDGLANEELKGLNGDGRDVWLNYNDIAREGNWLINRRPQITITGPDTVDEGPTPVTFEFSVADDPGDTFTPDLPDCGREWGDTGPGLAGELVADSFTYGNGSGSFQCVFAAGGSPQSDSTTTKVTIGGVDRLGVSDHLADTEPASAHSVAVANVAPAVATPVLEPMSIDENGVVRVAGRFTDPGDDRHEMRIDWGDGESDVVDLPRGDRSFQASHRYLDDAPTATPADTYPVRVGIADERGPRFTTTLAVTVSNVAPEVELDPAVDELGNWVGSDIPVALQGLELSIEGRFSDVGTLDTHVVDLDWGDGSPSQAATESRHRYAEAGKYRPTLTVTDDDTGVGADSSPLTVLAPAEAILLVVGELESTPAQGRSRNLLDRAVERLQGARSGAAPNGALDFLRKGRPAVAIEMLERAAADLSDAEAGNAGLDLASAKDLLALTAKSIALETLNDAEATGATGPRRLQAATGLFDEADAQLLATGGANHVAAIDLYGRSVARL